MISFRISLSSPPLFLSYSSVTSNASILRTTASSLAPSRSESFRCTSKLNWPLAVHSQIAELLSTLCSEAVEILATSAGTFKRLLLRVCLMPCSAKCKTRNAIFIRLNILSAAKNPAYSSPKKLPSCAVMNYMESKATAVIAAAKLISTIRQEMFFEKGLVMPKKAA